MQMQVHVITTDETLRIIPEVPQPEQEICDLSEHVSAEEETVDNTNGICLIKYQINGQRGAQSNATANLRRQEEEKCCIVRSFVIKEYTKEKRLADSVLL